MKFMTSIWGGGEKASASCESTSLRNLVILFGFHPINNQKHRSYRSKAYEHKRPQSICCSWTTNSLWRALVLLRLPDLTRFGCPVPEDDTVSLGCPSPAMKKGYRFCIRLLKRRTHHCASLKVLLLLCGCLYRVGGCIFFPLAVTERSFDETLGCIRCLNPTNILRGLAVLSQRMTLFPLAVRALR